MIQFKDGAAYDRYMGIWSQRAAAYSWDMDGGGFPYAVLQEEMRGLGIPVPTPPHPEASRMEILRA